MARATSFMIGIRNSALRFWMSCHPPEYGHWPFRRGVRISTLSPSAGFVPSGKNAFPNSFYSEKLRYAGRYTNTSNIIILNETTRLRATSSSSLLQTYRKVSRAGLFAVATDSAAC